MNRVIKLLEKIMEAIRNIRRFSDKRGTWKDCYMSEPDVMEELKQLENAKKILLEK
jgi:hypothetical protein